MTGRDGVEERWDVRGIHASIGIDHHDHVAGGGLEAGAQGVPLPGFSRGR